ncbi:MAG TPA: glycosyltransferase family 87 protein [Tepidisphaeraceae bacterium]|nr:glycosyltransferase family 87 protein [Tepidisphaeraceae bacterium]
MAKQGMWDAIYPVPIPGAKFIPAAPQGSIAKPQYAAAAQSAGIHGDPWRVVQAPPVCLLFAPLAMFPLHTAFLFYRFLSTICVWVVALYAGLIAGRIIGRPTRLSGSVAALIGASPNSLATIRTGNVSSIVAALIAVAIYELQARDGWRGGAAALGAFVLKYASFPLLPVAIVAGRLRTVAWAALLLLAFVLIPIPFIGVAPYREFAFKIAPHFDQLEAYYGNQALRAVLARCWANADPPVTFLHAFSIVRWATFALFVFVLYSARCRIQTSARLIASASALMLCWFLIFSPVAHAHYYLYIFPLWGWLIIELRRVRFGLALATIAIALMWIPLAGGRWSHLPLVISAHMLLAAIIMMVVALISIVRREADRGSMMSHSTAAIESTVSD